MKKLIVIEGSDGSGKQTQSDLLKKYFEDNNLKYFSCSFPNYNSQSSALVKMYLNGEFGTKPSDVNPYIASSFFAVDRYATYKKEIEKHYLNNEIILLDRYTTANMIHQACKIEDKAEIEKYISWLFDLEFNKFELPKPDIVFFLDMPPKFSTYLMQNRANKITNEEEKDIHEKDISYLKKAYDTSKYIAKKYNWNIIDCVENEQIKTIEDIHSDIVNKLKTIL